MNFLKNFVKKKESKDSGGFQDRSMNMPPGPDADSMLPSLSDEKLDDLDLPELPDLDDLGVPSSPKNPAARAQPAQRGIPRPNAGPVSPVHRQMRPKVPMQVTNKEVKSMQPMPSVHRGPVPVHNMPSPAVGPPKGFGNALSGLKKPGLAKGLMAGPAHPAGRKDESTGMLKKMDFSKGAGHAGSARTPFLGSASKNLGGVHEGPSRMPHSGDVFIKGEDYREIMESINSIIAFRNGQIGTSEALNFNHVLNDKFEKNVEKIKDKILSVDEMLFE